MFEGRVFRFTITGDESGLPAATHAAQAPIDHHAVIHGFLEKGLAMSRRG